MYDIVALGECLIDFVSKGNGTDIQLEGNPGGAPANVLAAAAKLGLKTAFIGKVGNDSFGLFLKAALEKAQIDTSSLVMSDDYPTTIAIVSLDQTGNRSFSFYRRQTADVNLTESEIGYDLIKKAGIFHFGSVSLTDEPSRSSTYAAVRFAKANNITISYDPNFRERLWKTTEEAKREMLRGMEFADIVKVSDEELFFLTGIKDMEQAMRMLYQQYDLRLLAVTMGPKGCCCQIEDTILSAPTFDVPCVDTTGAGDAYLGALLFKVLRNKTVLAENTKEDLMSLMDFANAAGSLATTKRGAIPAMPSESEILDCIAHVPYIK